MKLRQCSAAQLAGYIIQKRFLPEQLDELAKDNPDFAVRLAEARREALSRPNPEEMKQHEAVVAAAGISLDEDATENAVDSYLQEWGNTESARNNVEAVRKIKHHIEERKIFRSLKIRVEEALAAHNETGQMPSPEIGRAVNDFIRQWSAMPEASEDIQTASVWKQSLDMVFAQLVAQQWQRLLDDSGNLRDIEDLAVFMRRYPMSDTMRRQADDLSWLWVQRQSDLTAASVRYDQLWNHVGIHSGEAARVRESATEWARYSSADIFQIIEFLNANPGHPFESSARRRIQELKAETLEEIRMAPQLTRFDDFMELRSSGAFSEEELMEAAGVDEKFYRNVLSQDKTKVALPNIEDISLVGGCEGQSGVTDVVFFGITSSGKTCLLSGLLRNGNLTFDGKSYSGEYGDFVRTYSEAGVALSGTPRDFVATIKARAKIPGSRCHYDFNLFEMAGEDFRDRIANARGHDGGVVALFADMGSGAPEILASGNDKLFFILIDPTVDYIQLQEQKQAMRAMKDLMFPQRSDNPNGAIMSRVKGLHFIVTKSDMLPGPDRRKAALEVVRSVINHSDADYMVEQCRSYGINANKDPQLDGRPRVFCYSLGHFTIGNIFEYNPEGSDNIIKVICDYCSPTRKAGFWHGFRNFFTKPIF